MAVTLKNQAVIVGVGETSYCQRPGSGVSDLKLILTASLRAIADSGLRPNEIDGIIAPFMHATAEDFAANFGIKDLRYAVQVNMGGASAVAALQSAAMAVACGLARHVLIPTGWNGYSGLNARDFSGSADVSLPISASLRDYCLPWGASSPIQWYALLARRYMHLYGPVRNAMGRIALTARNNAQLNDNAIMKGRTFTMEDYLASPIVSDPYSRLDCCQDTDAAAAVVVTSAEHAGNFTRHVPVLISGVAEGHPYPADDITNRPHMLDIGLTYAAPRAYEIAGLGPEDMDFAQIYDPFTFQVLHQLEEAGFCRRGEGGRFVESGAIELGSALPINTHGGLLSEAHAIGMNHIIEAVRQLRHEAGKRQVTDARFGVVTGWGDFGDGSIAILSRPASSRLSG